MTNNQILYRKHYRAILIDPPWAFKARAPNKNPNSDRSVEKHYKTMKLADIKAMGEQIRELAHPKGCHIFLCSTGPFLEKSFEVFKAWKVRYSSVGFYYLKIKLKIGSQPEFITTDIRDLQRIFHTGLGFTTRKNIEPIILGRIGSPTRKGKDVPELILDPIRDHSQKPDELYRRIERYCDGPYLSLFDREDRGEQWTCWGDEMEEGGEKLK